VVKYRGPWARPVARWSPALGEQNRGRVEAAYAELVRKYGPDRAELIGRTDRVLLIFPNFFPPLDGLDLPHLRAAMWAVDAEMTAGGAGGRLAAESLANVLAVHLFRHVLAPHEPGRGRDGALPQGRLRAVVEYIEEHLNASPQVLPRKWPATPLLVPMSGAGGCSRAEGEGRMSGPDLLQKKDDGFHRHSSQDSAEGQEALVPVNPRELDRVARRSLVLTHPRKQMGRSPARVILTKGKVLTWFTGCPGGSSSLLVRARLSSKHKPL
jgi:hypothetical protein